MKPAPAPQRKDNEVTDHPAGIGLFTGNGREYDLYRPATGEPLPMGTYVLRAQPMRGYYLDKVEDIPLPKRIYGKCHADRIIEACASRASQGISTGVWLNGEKGSGKTMLAAVLAAKMRDTGAPTILVQTPFHGPEFNTVIEHLGRACLIFDEFEKVYNEDEHQNALLTVFAGAVVARHLYVVTTNDSYKVSEAMRNRPSRMRYFIEHRGLPEDLVTDYVTENLKDKTKIKEMVKALEQVSECNFDIMMCAVEEHNRFGGDVAETLTLMNISRHYNTKYKLSFTGEINRGNDKMLKCTGTGAWEGDLYRQLSDDDDYLHIGVRIEYAKSATGKTPEPHGWNLTVRKQEIEYATDGSITLKVDCDDSNGFLTLRNAAGFTNWRQRF